MKGTAVATAAEEPSAVILSITVLGFKIELAWAEPDQEEQHEEEWQ